MSNIKFFKNYTLKSLISFFLYIFNFFKKNKFLFIKTLILILLLCILINTVDTCIRVNGKCMNGQKNKLLVDSGTNTLFSNLSDSHVWVLFYIKKDIYLPLIVIIINSISFLILLKVLK